MGKNGTKIKTFNTVFSMPMAAAMTGFGFFWWFRIFHWNVFVSMVIALYVAAIMSIRLYKG